MVIDRRGFRCGIVMALLNHKNQFFWGHRFQRQGWQFPQGGLMPKETAEEAMYRELDEETALKPEDIEIISVSKDWLRYRLPEHMIRPTEPRCIGQRQKWFLLRMTNPEANIDFMTTDIPEFDRHRWVSYWYPIDHIIHFKRGVYRKALNEFSSLIIPNS